MTGGGPAAVDVEHLFADYRRLRDDVGARLVPRDVVLVHGTDAASYLQGQCSQDVLTLGLGHSAETLLLSPQGKLDAYLRLTRWRDDAFVLDVTGGFGDAVIERLRRFKLRVKADIENLAWSCISLRGPGAAALVSSGTASPPEDGLCIGYQWGSVQGADLLGPDVQIPDGTAVSDPWAWETLRIEAGIPEMGRELDERTIAAEAGLLERTVSFTKGCYTGQELVARLDARGNKVARHLRGLVLGPDVRILAPRAGTSDAEPVPRGASLIDTNGKTVGEVTSSALSPVLGVVALAYVHRAVAPGDAVTVAQVGAAPNAVVGGGEPTMTAEVRELPLVP